MIKAGSWYLAVRCGVCGAMLPYVEIPEDGLIGHDSGIVEMSCPFCHSRGRYPLAKMERRQARADTPTNVTRH